MADILESLANNLFDVAYSNATPVFLRGQLDKGPDGGLRDAGKGNVFAFKGGTRLTRPASQPLTFGEQLVNEPNPSPAPNFFSTSGPTTVEPNGQTFKDFLQPVYSTVANAPSTITQLPNPAPRTPWMEYLVPEAKAAEPTGNELSPAERELWTKESGLNPHADNPTSTAFGIWQGLQSNRNKYGSQLGIDPNTTNMDEQVAMGRAYIRDTYGTAERANAFWDATKKKNPSLAPADLQGKVRQWIAQGYVGY